MNKKFLLFSIIPFIICQVVKFIVVGNINVNDSIVIINNIFNITYVQNTGAAWSIMSDNNILLIIISVVLLCVVIGFINNFKLNIRNKIAFILLIGGILSNLCDRVINHYVVDYFNFSFINFPIFNIADMCIVFGIILIIIAIIKKEDVK